MRLMAVALTEAAVRDRTKTVSRRLGWLFARPGDRLALCVKVMGRRRGEALVRLAAVELVDVRREPLAAITPDDVAREGFPGWTARQFIDFYTAAMHVPETVTVTRLEWRYLEAAP